MNVQELLKQRLAQRRGTQRSGMDIMGHPQGVPAAGQEDPRVQQMIQDGLREDEIRRQLEGAPGGQSPYPNEAPEVDMMDDAQNPGSMWWLDSKAKAPGIDPNARFDDANATQTAEMDAFKLMDLQPEYQPAVEADINTTEGGRLSLLRRMMFADAALEDPRLPKAMTRMDNGIAGRMGALGRLYTGDEYELGRLMSEQFANAVLRNDSGAAAPDSEVKRYAGQYFPQANDSDGQIQAKRALRREMIRSMQQSLGGDAAPAVQQMMQEMELMRQQADVPEAGEISTEDQEFLKTLGIN